MSFSLYLFTVLWYTVFCRTTQYHFAQTEVFWSYKKWLSGDTNIGFKIIANIAMFIPFGFFISLLKEKNTFLTVMAFGVVFSFVIENLQLFFMRGLFEWDDLINNIAGSILGYLLAKGIFRWISLKRSMSFISCLVFIFVLTCTVVLIIGPGENDTVTNTLSKQFCFQVDSTQLEGNTLTIGGFAFRYEQKPCDYTIVLQSTNNGKDIEFKSECGIERKDVNSYFSCEFDYSHTGFTATGTVDPTDEYEVMIRWPWSVPVPTGVYLTGSEINYFPQEKFVEPELDEMFVTEGIPRVYRPDYHCWVYQYRNELYWIVDSDFYFEEDGTTRIQYQTWTTQIQNLPASRLEKNYFWDNLSAYFEKNELTGSFGPYRVMKRELPTAYALTSIVTGYYANKKWEWREYFRPIYEFDAGLFVDQE